MHDLFQILAELIKAFPESEHVRRAVVFSVFRKAAGEGLLDHAVPTELESTRLTVSVADAVWKRHLESLAPGLITSINKLAGARVVTFIEFHVDAGMFEGIASDRKSRKKERREPESYSVPEDLKEKAAAIRDPELRRLFMESAGAYLAARDKNGRSG